MSYARRSLTTNLTPHLARRFHPSLAHIAHGDDDERGRAQPRNPPPSPPVPSRSGASASPFIRSFSAGFVSRGGLLGVSFPLGVDHCLLRRYSTDHQRTEEVSYANDAPEVLSSSGMDGASDAVAAVVPPAPFPGEVAAAAADSFPLVAGLQHLIDGVHSFTGLNWWACIALTTVLIRGATIPLLLNQLKDTYKLTAMRPELEQLKDEIANSTDPQSMQEGRKKVKALFQKHGVNPLSPLKGLFVQGPIFISFFFAISNMVEKVPSFKGGGALWFTDLTTPDPQYILPGLTALSFLATVELNMQEGMEGNPVAKTMKKFSRGLAFLTVPITAHFPKAIFCYWITSNLFSLLYGFLLKRPPVRKLLGLPDIVPQDTLPVQPTFFAGSNSNESTSQLSAKEPEESNPLERRISSSSVINQRIRVLEKADKARNMK